MISKIFSTSIILVFFVSAASLAQISIGYMSTQEVFNQLPERQQIEEQLNNLIAEKQQELEQRTTAYQGEVAQYQQNQAVMSEQQRQTREDELAEMEASVIEFQQSIQVEIQQRRAELLQPVYNRIDQAIAAIAEERGLDFVLNESTNMGENIVYFSSSQQLNITSEVIERLKNDSTSNEQ